MKALHLDRIRARVDDMRRRVPRAARIVVGFAALALTLGTWMPLVALAVGSELPAWELLVHETSAPFCHQHPWRSFHVAHHVFPLCTRCSGMWLGITLGIVAAMLVVPRRRWSVGLAVAAAATALSWLDKVREESSGIDSPWIRFSLGMIIFLGITLAASFDTLAVLMALGRGSRRLIGKLLRIGVARGTSGA